MLVKRKKNDIFHGIIAKKKNKKKTMEQKFKDTFDLFILPKKKIEPSIVGPFLFYCDTVLFYVIDERCLAVLDGNDRKRNIKTIRKR